jgi:hypothetical protein
MKIVKAWFSKTLWAVFLFSEGPAGLGFVRKPDYLEGSL